MRQRNIRRLRATQGCLTDCVAYLLNQHPHRVPYFIYPRDGWFARFKGYFRRRGYHIYWKATTKIPRHGTHIVCGDSLRWKTLAHSVVYHKGRLAYDPQYPSKWTDKRITHRLVVRKEVTL